MSKRRYAMVTVLGCVPYAFLAIWGDAEKGTMAFYALFVLGVAVLLLLCRRKDAFLAMLGCGTLSCLTSCLRFPLPDGEAGRLPSAHEAPAPGIPPLPAGEAAAARRLAGHGAEGKRKSFQHSS